MDGEILAEAVQLAGEELEAAFRVEWWDPADFAKAGTDGGRYEAEAVLDILNERHPDLRAVAVVSAPLFQGDIVDLYGWSRERDRKAAVSTPPLSLTRDKKSARRLAAEILHEIGHTYGLKHCPYPTNCAMRRSGRIEHTDQKGSHYCNHCRMMIQDKMDRECAKPEGEEPVGSEKTK